MEETHIKLGKFGEEYASRWLINNGWVIIRRNYHDRFSEVDIIARSSDGILVFFEIKALSGGSSHEYSPEDHMNKLKIDKLIKTCEMFSAKHPELICDSSGWRIDLLALTINTNNVVVKHYKNVV